LCVWAPSEEIECVWEPPAPEVNEMPWVCEGRFVVAMVRLFVPPVALTAVVPAPMTNFSRRSGVELLPLHKTQPVGIAASAPDQMMMPPVGKVVFKMAWVPVTGPVILGKVALRVLLIRRMWSSAAERASVDAGLVATRSSMYVPVSKAILRFPLCVFLGWASAQRGQ